MRIRIGNYRIVYEVRREELLVLVTRVEEIVEESSREGDGSVVTWRS